MIQIERLMRALECCAGEGECARCPYNSNPETDDFTGCRQMHRDALTLMDGYRAAMEPRIAHLVKLGTSFEPDFGKVTIWTCSACDAPYKSADEDVNARFCYNCGARLVNENADGQETLSAGMAEDRA